MNDSPWMPLFGILIFVAEIGFLAWVAISIRNWQRRRKQRVRPSDVTAVAPGAPRQGRPRTEEIDLQPGVDFKATPRKGEPILAPGGWLILAGFVLAGLYGYFGRQFLDPILRPLIGAILPLSQ